MSVTTIERPAFGPRHAAGTARPGTRPSRRRLAPLLVPLFLAAVGGASIVALLIAPADLRYVLGPLLSLLFVTLTYASVLYLRDRQLPVFEPASLCVAATFFYAAFPLVNFIAGGLRWHPLSDARLMLWDPDAREVAAFGWRYVLYFACFVATYLLVRGRHSVRTTKVERPGTARVLTILLIGVGAFLFLGVLSAGYGISLSPTYSEVFSGQAKTLASLPHRVLQLAHNVLAIRVLIEQLFILLLLLQWRHLAARFALAGFLMFVAITTAGGARTEMVVLVLTTVLFYHRVVKPLKLSVLLLAGAAIMSAFLFLGVIRDVGGADVHAATDTPMLATTNEFQVLFANGIDLHQRRLRRELPPVPWQLYWYELTQLVPSQLLPFQKVDPSIWYLAAVLEADGWGIGLMFGLLAQAAVGWDHLELALRGIALGLFLALLQRWYARRPTNFWATVLVAFLSVWIFYTIRQTTFSFLYFVMYRFMPTMIMVELLRLVMMTPRRVHRRMQRLQ